MKGKSVRREDQKPGSLLPLVILLIAALIACGGDGSPGDSAGDATPRPTSAGGGGATATEEPEATSEPAATSEPEAQPTRRGVLSRAGSQPAGPEATEEAGGAMLRLGESRDGNGGEGRTGDFVSVSAGYDHTCGVRADGSVECWGANGSGQATPPRGEFASVSAGTDYTCGVKSDGSVECWGRAIDSQASPPPRGKFASVSAGIGHACGVRTDGAVECWGMEMASDATGGGGKYASVSTGYVHTCGVGTDGAVECWASVPSTAVGFQMPPLPQPPPGEFASVSVGWSGRGLSHICGIKIDGSLECWGMEGSSTLRPPAGDFVSVSAGGNAFSSSGYACGLKRDGSVECWGNPPGGGRTTPQAGEFVSVSAGGYHACGVKTDGSVACWGEDRSGRHGHATCRGLCFGQRGAKLHLRGEDRRLRRMLGR